MTEKRSSTIYQQNLPSNVQEFIIKIKPHSSSIILGGSRAKGLENRDSDVDLCIICSNDQKKRKVASVFRGIDSSTSNKRILVDAKIFTEAEFKTIVQGTQNAYWYIFINNGVPIYGEDINVVLFPHQFRNTVWTSINELRSSIDFIEQRTYSEIIGYKVYSALCTCYTVESLYNRRPFIKSEIGELVNRLFGNQKKIVMTLYNCIRRQMRFELATKGITTNFKLPKIGHCRDLVGSHNIENPEFKKSIQRALLFAEKLYYLLEDT